MARASDTSAKAAKPAVPMPLEAATAIIEPPKAMMASFNWSSLSRVISNLVARANTEFENTDIAVAALPPAELATLSMA